MTDQTPMDLSAIKARHPKYVHGPTDEEPEGDEWCGGCGLDWPCDAYRLAEECERLRANTPEIQAAGLRLLLKARDAEIAALKASLHDALAQWQDATRDERRAIEERDSAREALVEFAEFDCAYGDGCPDNARTRHGRCVGCKARAALSGQPSARGGEPRG